MHTTREFKVQMTQRFFTFYFLNNAIMMYFSLFHVNIFLISSKSPSILSVLNKLLKVF